MSFDNLPDEMKQYRQWIVWRYEQTDSGKPTKVPYTVFGEPASVTDPNTWTDFASACIAARQAPNDGLGFVFTDADPFIGVDLDEPKDAVGNLLTGEAYNEVIQRQIKVFQSFDSYTEHSPSGKGLHILGRASVPGGRRRASMEIYSSRRYFTMTGNVYHNVPIKDVQGVAEILYNQMGGGIQRYTYDGDAEEKDTDENIMAMALAAVNGDKFNALITDNWQQYYTSQSEADFAFIDIVAFYTQNRNQIMRLFRACPLGQRRKAKRDKYVTDMIAASFDRMLPPLDMSGLHNAVEDYKAQQTASATPPAPAAMGQADAQGAGAASLGHKAEPAPAPAITYPRGLVGEIARFIYSASPRPVDEISIAAALGLMAGICGRSYNVSGSGLNLYMLMLAHTGVGKEAIATGINRLIQSVSRISGDGSIMSTPSIAKFIGPEEISSGQALQKALATQSCFVSIVGEFGLRIAALASPRIMQNDIMLKRTLLSLYSRSGKGQAMGAMAYSDKDKNIAQIQAPAFSLLGESTPETFYQIIDEALINDGLLPRFLVIEYTGERKQLNKQHAWAQPTFELSDRLGKLVIQAHALSGQGNPLDVSYGPGAEQWADEFDAYCTNKINATGKEAVRHLWNRAHLKLLRIAALVAVGSNPLNPVIEREDIAWAYNLVNADIVRLIGKFERGETGRVEEFDNLRQLKDMYKAFMDFNTRPFDELRNYGVKQDAHTLHMISHSYVSRKLSAVASFRKDRRGATVAIKACLTELLTSGVIAKVPPQQVANVLKASGDHYALVDLNWTV